MKKNVKKILLWLGAIVVIVAIVFIVEIIVLNNRFEQPVKTEIREIE